MTKRKPRTFALEVPNADGWSDWIHPLPGYRMACCDCCCVHDLETDIADDGKVIIRLRRNVRATYRLRKREGVRVKPEVATTGGGDGG